MATKEDLQKKIQSLKDQLSSAIASLNEILCAEYRFQPGTVVIRGKDEFTVSCVKISYGRAVAFGKKKLKDGSLGRQEFELYGHIVAKLEPTHD